MDRKTEQRRRWLILESFSKGLPKYHRAVKWVAAYAALGYLEVMICFLFAWCRPVSWYWKVPVPNCKYTVILLTIPSPQKNEPAADQLPFHRHSAMCKLLPPSNQRCRMEYHIRPANPLPTHPTITQGATPPQKVRTPTQPQPSIQPTNPRPLPPENWSSSASSPSAPSSSSAPS